MLLYSAWLWATIVQLYPGRDKNQPITVLIFLSESLGI